MTKPKIAIEEMIDSLCHQINGAGQGTERYILNGVLDFAKELREKYRQQLDGVSLIAQERHEQKTKHGYTDEFQAQNPQYYSDGQLTDAAHYAITLHGWPASWGNTEARERIAQKSYRDRLIVAGALIAAEIDRLQTLSTTHKIEA